MIFFFFLYTLLGVYIKMSYQYRESWFVCCCVDWSFIIIIFIVGICVFNTPKKGTSLLGVGVTAT